MLHNLTVGGTVGFSVGFSGVGLAVNGALDGARLEGAAVTGRFVGCFTRSK